MMINMIPITKPTFGDSEEKMVLESIRSGWVSMGPKVKEFEGKAAKYVNSKYAVAASSCTTALHLALVLKGAGEGDEVIVPSYSFIASANCIVYTRAKPVFVDIDPNTYNIDPSKIRSVISKKTKGILAVHQVGLSADMDEIHKIAKENNLWVIEDAACALGAEYKGKKIGSISELTCFSLHPRKAITTGDGGLITTNSKNHDSMARILRSHGADISDLARHKSKKILFEDYPVLGYNYRMTDLQGALGLAQFERLEGFITKRRELAKKYDQAFKDDPDVSIPFEPEYAKHVYQSYMITLSKRLYKFRTKIIEDMLEKGVALRRGIPSIHKTAFYKKDFGEVNLPNTEYASQAALMIPLYPTMKDEEQSFVIKALTETLNTYRK